MGDVSSSQERTRAEIAEYLREFADELDSGDARSSKGIDEPGRSGDSAPAERTDDGGKVTIVAGNESATINPPETLTFDVEVATDSSLLEGGGTERSATFSLRWNEDHVEEDDELDVR
ncbi:amphi-Trp domain-containing protein [Halalkalicoccus ordinarius]|uniref:amphi-Trp domain-containing protein n=1 Tax=Halalkalicoccus ordinarius TaxID=3116651 RepID=UPI00300F725F